MRSRLPLSLLLAILFTPALLATEYDFDNDGKADIAVRRASNGFQYILNSSGTSFNSERGDSIQRIALGNQETDIPVSGDFDGDGIWDVGVRRPSTFEWIIRYSSTGEVNTFTFGRNTDDIPVPADYDGDGTTDLAVRRPSTQYWYIKNSSGDDEITGNSDGITRLVFGRNITDIPVPADYDGDGKADIAVRRPSNFTWYIRNSSGIDARTNHNDGITRAVFGRQTTDIPVPADYDADGKADIAVRRPSNFTWYIKNSNGSNFNSDRGDGIQRIVFGRNEYDIPVPADYDGDSYADVAVRRPSNQFFYTKNSSDGELQRYNFGRSEDDCPTIAFPVVYRDFCAPAISIELETYSPEEVTFSYSFERISNTALEDALIVGFYFSEPIAPVTQKFSNTGITDMASLPLGSHGGFNSVTIDTSYKAHSTLKHFEIYEYRAYGPDGVPRDDEGNVIPGAGLVIVDGINANSNNNLVIVNKTSTPTFEAQNLNPSSHFLGVRVKYPGERYQDIYVTEKYANTTGNNQIKLKSAQLSDDAKTVSLELLIGNDFRDYYLAGITANSKLNSANANENGQISFSYKDAQVELAGLEDSQTGNIVYSYVEADQKAGSTVSLSIGMPEDLFTGMLVDETFNLEDFLLSFNGLAFRTVIGASGETIFKEIEFHPGSLEVIGTSRIDEYSLEIRIRAGSSFFGREIDGFVTREPLNSATTEVNGVQGFGIVTIDYEDVIPGSDEDLATFGVYDPDLFTGYHYGNGLSVNPKISALGYFKIVLSTPEPEFPWEERVEFYQNAHLLPIGLSFEGAGGREIALFTN